MEHTLTTRLRLGIASLAALVALAAMAIGASSAPAQVVGFDPQDTNVPYLAWRGSEVRLVKCFPAGTPGAAGVSATFFVEDWSGDPHQRPNFATAGQTGGFAGPFAGTGNQAGRVCFSDDIVSLKPGMAIVKMKVLGANNVVVAEHQFLVAWMNIGAATLTDIGPTTAPAGVLTQTGSPTGGGVNQARVLVTGTIPLGGNFSELGLGASLTLPNDWARLAGVMARTSLPGNERNPNSWDIHDEFTPGLAAPPGVGQTAAQHAATHQVGGLCPGTSTSQDVVDNCLGGGEFGPFSRFIYGFAAGTPDMTQATVGPFDPLRPNTSYLPNGTLDAGDAPMPSIRVDYHLGGLGILVPVDKHNVYRAALGGETPNTIVHDLYGPFYGTFLPATAAGAGAAATTAGAPVAPAIAPTTASGTDAGAPNNFHSYLVRGLYHYWDHAVALARTSTPGFLCPPFVGGDFLGPNPPARQATIPLGMDVSVYTDEHGEARVGWIPGTAFDFAAIATRNLNQGCDIQGVNPLGTGTISADVRYPHQPITAADVRAAGSVTKTVTSLFNKQVTCVPKGPGLANQVAFVCTVLAVGITGAPFVNETVCISTNAERISAISSPEVVNPRRGTIGQEQTLCLRTNASGQAVVEILGKGTLNVIADFIEENVLRFITLAPPTTVPMTPGGTPPATSPTGTAGVQTSTQQPTQAQVVSLGGSPTVTKPVVVKRTATLQSARIVETKKGRKVVVRVRSAKATAKIRIVFRAQNGAKVAAAVRKVRTNRAVSVPKLIVPRRAATMTVSVIR